MAWICHAALVVGEQQSKVSIEVPPEHPFFVYGQGWSSCSPGGLHNSSLCPAIGSRWEMSASLSVLQSLNSNSVSVQLCSHRPAGSSPKDLRGQSWDPESNVTVMGKASRQAGSRSVEPSQPGLVLRPAGRLRASKIQHARGGGAGLHCSVPLSFRRR